MVATAHERYLQVRQGMAWGEVPVAAVGGHRREGSVGAHHSRVPAEDGTAGLGDGLDHYTDTEHQARHLQEIHFQHQFRIVNTRDEML